MQIGTNAKEGIIIHEKNRTTAIATDGKNQQFWTKAKKNKLFPKKDKDIMTELNIRRCDQ